MATRLKNAGGVRKNAGDARKNADDARKNAGRVRKNAGGVRKNAGTAEEDLGIAGLKAPTLPHVALTAPARTGRALQNVDVALDSVEARLLLAWKYRSLLDPALPKHPPFHATAWTALNVLRGTAENGGAAQDTTAATAQAALDALLKSTMRLRNVVAMTTHAGDEARADLGFGTPLKSTRALVSHAASVIAAARKWQHAFPALTDRLIAEADKALVAARKAVAGRRQGDLSATVDRADSADPRQLATDVLLDEIDHLRAAAVATLENTRPQLAAFLSAPLEHTHGAASSAHAAPPAASAGAGASAGASAGATNGTGE